MRLLRLSVTFPQPFLRPGCRQQLGEGVWWQPPNTTDKQEKAPTDRAARHTQWEPGGRFPKTIAQILTRWLTGLTGVETYEPEQQPASGVMSSMEQRRFYEVRGEESDEWLVLDGKRHPPRVICRCVGWNAPKNAALIATALEAHDSELYSKFPIDGSGRLNEQPDVKASGEAESPPALKSATRISRSRHRG